MKDHLKRQSKKMPVLFFPKLSDEEFRIFSQDYDVTFRVNGVGLSSLDPAYLQSLRCVLTTGPIGFTSEMLSLCPSLEAIISLGAGYDRIDLASARRRNIVIATGMGANANSVAEHAWALLLSLVRRIPFLDRNVRQGVWQEAPFLPPEISGKRMGIIGMGPVGRAIARLGQGFQLSISYTARSIKPDLTYDFRQNVKDLAARSDILMVACSGGPETCHLVDAEVLSALGPQGLLVNISRGSVVNTQALLSALTSQKLLGAALDVYENEPEVPDALKALDNVILTPHVAGRSEASRQAMVATAKANLDAFFSGRPMPGAIKF